MRHPRASATRTGMLLPLCPRRASPDLLTSHARRVKYAGYQHDDIQSFRYLLPQIRTSISLRYTASNTKIRGKFITFLLEFL